MTLSPQPNRSTPKLQGQADWLCHFLIVARVPIAEFHRTSAKTAAVDPLRTYSQRGDAALVVAATANTLFHVRQGGSYRLQRNSEMRIHHVDGSIRTSLSTASSAARDAYVTGL